MIRSRSILLKLIRRFRLHSRPIETRRRSHRCTSVTRVTINESLISICDQRTLSRSNSRRMRTESSGCTLVHGHGSSDDLNAYVPRAPRRERAVPDEPTYGKSYFTYIRVRPDLYVITGLFFSSSLSLSLFVSHLRETWVGQVGW